ncbi:hypothetical protein [Micromonospora psammae]|uniref:hypothetical protein n=1 Tax=Micromonospora sp. CPCC 205556 TaxID=3122398 RepID=UPI002FF28CFE
MTDMPWSVDTDEPKDAALWTAALLAVGRALYLANTFEAKCKAAFRVRLILDAIASHGDQWAEPAAAAADADATLARAITTFNRGDGEQLLRVLHRARDARNYIAHEGGNFNGLFFTSEDHLLDKLLRLRAEVHCLALGDDLVSQLIHEIHRKTDSGRGLDPGQRRTMPDYAGTVDRWVFGDADLLERLHERQERHWWAGTEPCTD